MKVPTALSVLLTAVAIIAFAAGALALAGMRVARVVDGDSVRLNLGVLARIEGIDAPERGHRARCPQEAALAEAASTRLEQIAAAPGAYVIWTWHLEKFGRPMVRVMLDGRDAGAMLVSEGLARAYGGGKRAGWCPAPGMADARR